MFRNPRRDTGIPSLPLSRSRKNGGTCGFYAPGWGGARAASLLPDVPLERVRAHFRPVNVARRVDRHPLGRAGARGIGGRVGDEELHLAVAAVLDAADAD